MRFCLLMVMPAVTANFSLAIGQSPVLRAAAYNGTLLAGYVDQGAFLNFTGPNFNLSSKNSVLSFGMLPSLRFKEDNSTPKNSFVTPNLGVGVTFGYKLLAVQVPVYYNAKTATANGKWRAGIGIGIRLKEFKKESKQL